jgi:hypothetical protein
LGAGGATAQAESNTVSSNARKSFVFAMPAFTPYPAKQRLPRDIQRLQHEGKTIVRPALDQRFNNVMPTGTDIERGEDEFAQQNIVIQRSKGRHGA